MVCNVVGDLLDSRSASCHLNAHIVLGLWTFSLAVGVVLTLYIIIRARAFASRAVSGRELAVALWSTANGRAVTFCGMQAAMYLGLGSAKL